MAKRAFEDFADISEVLQPLPSTKMAWRSNFTIVASLSLPLCLAPLVLQDVHWTLLASQTSLPQACVFAPPCLSLCFHFVGAGMC